jgi:hypothetical protein
MLTELLRRGHDRYSCLPILGPHLDGFLVWLWEKGYPPLPMRRTIEGPRNWRPLFGDAGFGICGSCRPETCLGLFLREVKQRSFWRLLSGRLQAISANAACWRCHHSRLLNA